LGRDLRLEATALHGITSRKTVILTCTADRTSNGLWFRLYQS